MNRRGAAAIALATAATAAIGAVGVVGAVGVLGTACTGAAAPHARAQRIAATSELIGGPKAIGQIGDFLLENDRIRVIVAGCPTDLPGCAGRGNTLYGGAIIDADLVRPGGGGGTRGNDQLAEILPAFLFEVIEPTSIEVTADGADGGPAEITVRGEGGDLLQLAALLVTGLVFPQGLTFEVVYALAPGKPYVEIRTTITNAGDTAHPFPFLDPPELADLLDLDGDGMSDIPGIDALQLSVPFGHLLLFGGEQQMFAPGPTGFDVRFSIEDSYAIATGFPAFPGRVVDHVATRGVGVSYGFAVPAGPPNYVNAFPAGYPGQVVTPASFLLGFNYASVAGAFTANPPAVLAPGERFTYTAYLVVGRGDAASVYDAILELRGAATGTFAGRIVDELSNAPVAGTSVVVRDAAGAFVTQAESDARGNFTAQLPPGAYRWRLVDDQRPPLDERAFEVTADRTTSAFIRAPSPGHLAVFVTDETGRPAPAKASLVARFDPAHAGDDPRDFLYSLPLGERPRSTAFEPTRTEYIEAAFHAPDGRIGGAVRPGAYELVVSRGPEYEVHRERIELVAGATTSRTVRLVRAFATDGWIGADVHLHAGPSTDSGLPIPDRVLACAVEGLDLAVATEHNFVADYEPAISALGLTEWMNAMVGIELTTFEMGHFNAYPLALDPGSTRGGEPAWTRQKPADMFAGLRALGADGPDRTIVQVNHPREQMLGYFATFFVDVDTGEPTIPAGIRAVFAPYGDEFQPDAFSYDFDAIELLTGKHFFAVRTFRDPATGAVVLGPDGRPAFPGTIESWFTLLDRGLRPSGMASSDSHKLSDEAGYGRTYLWVGAGRDTPGGYRRADVVDAVLAHRTSATNGPFVELTIAGAQGDAMIGDEVRAGPTVDVRVRIRAASWAAPDHLTIWSNSAPVVDVALPADRATDYDETFTLTLPRDAWVVAEVTGTRNMFPIVTAKEFEPLDATVVLNALGAGLDLSGLAPTGALKPDRTVIITPFAMTSPIWVDVDGGGWNPPRPPLSRRRSPAPAALPDLRDAFESLPGGVP